MQAVIMAGGKGTRLSSITNDEIPKPMVRLNGKPILEYQLEMLKRNGITDCFFIVGHLGEKIEQYFGDGSKWGMHVTYIHEKEPLGTAGALYYLKNRVSGSFLLVFGDLILDIDVTRFAQFHKSHGAEVSLLVHPNSHPYDSDIICLGKDNRVTGCDSKNNKRDDYYRNIVNAGVYMADSALLDRMEVPVKIDLEKDVIFPMVEKGGSVFGYTTSEYVKDVGTPERLRATEKDIQEGIVGAKNLSQKQKAIFFDRDGTLNKYVGLLADIEKFELEDDAAEAVKAVNRSEYLAIVVTNQPVVARGMCDISDVEDIHKKMETLLGEKGAYLDGISYCPHHPDKGYPEENPAYKMECDCRKPKPGMLLACAEALHIDLSASWMVGDTTTDIQTGKNAGCRTVLVHTGECGNDAKYDVAADAEAENLSEAVQFILSQKGDGR